MATHSSILACKIPWTGKPGPLESVSTELQSQTRLRGFHFHLPIDLKESNGEQDVQKYIKLYCYSK